MILHHKKTVLLLVLAVVLLSACSFFKKKEPPPPPPPPPPEPTRVVLKFEAAGDINPNMEGRASPLVLRIYQLKSYSDFMQADFFSLYDRGEEVLAGQVAGKQEITLKPNENRTVYFEPSEDTQTIGIMGLFVNSEGIHWKTVSGIQPHKTAVIPIQVNAAGLTTR